MQQPRRATSCRSRARSAARYLEQNVAAAELQLGADEIAEIEAAAPSGAVAGERFPEHLQRNVGR